MRVRSERPGRAYAAIPNAMLRDSALSMDARGLLALMMTYSDNWTFRRAHLMEVTGFGRDKYQRAIGELQKAGYLVRTETRGEGGKLLGSTWVLHDDPDRGPENQAVGAHRGPEKPTVGESAHIRRTDSEEEKKIYTPNPDLFSAEEAPNTKSKVEEQFETFWKEFPRRTNPSSKKETFTRFKQALKKAPYETLLQAARAYAATRAGEDPTFTKGAAPWLNGECWAAYVDADPDPELTRERARLRRLAGKA